MLISDGSFAKSQIPNPKSQIILASVYAFYFHKLLSQPFFYGLFYTYCTSSLQKP
ncbi:Uncharacterized protein dnm_014000 [Desulfonema magnum]|uniref:Uncharacterized protein n=1 Tax=Desulfonema magnum TaxID=45655 RepID=A0A975GL46_9BACT|nr:Uncharacterized protein dnm_014000 [Desulfonema magnum]